MTEHLPECPVEKMLRSGRTVGSQSCICEQLRACEQRCDEKRHAEVRAWSELSRDNFDDGFAAGLDAAREAVAAVEYLPTNPEKMIRSMALDAIDALKEKQ